MGECPRRMGGREGREGRTRHAGAAPLPVALATAVVGGAAGTLYVCVYAVCPGVGTRE